MSQMLAQIRSVLQSRELGDAHGQNALYEMPEMRQKVVAEESDKRYKARNFILLFKMKAVV